MAANREDRPSDFEDLISVREAAKILHVSESTVWRWIDKGVLKAYRVGPKRVCLRRAELAPVVITISHGEKLPAGGLSRYMFPMSPGPKPSTEEVLARAKALREKQAARRQGRPPEREAWEDINEMRDLRSEEI